MDNNNNDCTTRRGRLSVYSYRVSLIAMAISVLLMLAFLLSLGVMAGVGFVANSSYAPEAKDGSVTHVTADTGIRRDEASSGISTEDLD